MRRLILELFMFVVSGLCYTGMIASLSRGQILVSLGLGVTAVLASFMIAKLRMED